MKSKPKRPQVIYEGASPKAVILNLADCERLLERAEDLDDLRYLRKLRSRTRAYRPLEEVLAEWKAR